MKEEKTIIEALKSPLCVFTLSPPFTVQEFTRPSVQSASRRPATPYWRRSGYSLPRTRPRFKPSLKQASHGLAKYLTGRIKRHRRETLTLQEVLNTIRRVWTSPNIHTKSTSSPKMEERLRKKSSAPSDIPSPVLLRRRLSAPETIMRKHMLAQQRSESQDSDVTQASDVRSCQWRMETGVGSDPNLNRKRDHGLMRKSTLMRRLWGSTKPLSERSSRLSGSFYDWQYGKLTQGRSTQSLGSTHSSPEHLKCRSRTSLNGEELKTSPVHKKYDATVRKPNVIPKIQLRSQVAETSRVYLNGLDQNEITKRKLSVLNGNVDVQSSSLKTSCCSNYTYAASFDNPTSSVDSRLSTTKTSTITTTTETESEQYSTRSTSTTGTTIFSDNSDSAYTNTRSNYTHTSNENSSICTSTRSSERFLEENGNVADNENANVYRHVVAAGAPIQTENVDAKSNNPRPRVIMDKVNDSSTQTTDTANLNVISNVQLSQSTLNLIFNQVMQDVQKSPSTNINISTVSANIPVQSSVSKPTQSNLIQVQQVPSFYLKQKEAEIPAQEQHRILKYMVSNVGTGSPYSKPAEIPQVVVPRFSAIPRTTSMEVNTSSGESTDKESDNVSLVDSLEDPSSPRVDMNQNRKYDEKPVRGDLSPLLPDNSGTKFNRTGTKASAFFIPIEPDAETDVKSVADLLPEKVRERLSKRQLKREQKLRQAKDKVISPKSDSNYVSASDNGNHLPYTVDNAKYLHSASSVLPDINPNKSKRRNKPMLPNIESIRKVKTDFKGNLKQPETDKTEDKKLNKSVKRKMLSRSQDSQTEALRSEKKPNWMSKTRHKVLERLSPLYTTKNDYTYDVLPKRIYHKTEVSNLNKRIEILEIVECIEAIPDSSIHRLSKTKKSKIPVLVHSKLPSISREDKAQKPIFLDFEQMHDVEPKIDQLIANILIDALNKTDQRSTPEEKQKFSLISPLVTEKRPPPSQSPQTRHQGSKYQQMFESIPEERAASLQSSSEDASNTLGNEELRKPLQEDYTSGKTSNEASATKSEVPDGYKGKAALGILKDENFSTIPKGWITFYTLHKSQGSPESTSDEGKKKVMGSESTNYNGCLKGNSEKPKKIDKILEGNKRDEEENRKKSKNAGEIRLVQQSITTSEHKDAYMVPSKEADLYQDSIDTWTSSDQEKRMRVLHPLPHTGYVPRNQHKKGRYKTCDPLTNKSAPGGWSVTVSGTTSGGQFAPDLEMRLTFPRGSKNNPTNQSELGSATKRGNFPHLIHPKENNRTNCAPQTEHSCVVQQLPQIVRNRSTKKSRQCESGHLVNVKDYIEPRQTRTSTRRLLLNRPRTFITPAEFIDIDADNSNLREILEKFPEILKITGNAISPERKPRVPIMSEKDVTRHIYRNT